jgi:hypothetical protein
MNKIIKIIKIEKFSLKLKIHKKERRKKIIKKIFFSIIK